MRAIGEFAFPLVIRHEVLVFRKQKQPVADIRANTPDKLVGKGTIGRILTDHPDGAALRRFKSRANPPDTPAPTPRYG